MPKPVRINLGGEGEVPGVLNQQPPFALLPSWRSLSRKTLAQLRADGHQFIIADNTRLPFPNDWLDEVITNAVPIDRVTAYGPGVQSDEVRRILKSGGRWVNNRRLKYVKP
jgi:ubiquinone/menaquinone biosynthesis C-methylase UbiE